MNQIEKYSPRREHLARHLHSLGPQPMFLALLQVDAGHNLDEVLEEFRRVDPGLCRAMSADRFPPRPVYAVGGDR